MQTLPKRMSENSPVKDYYTAEREMWQSVLKGIHIDQYIYPHWTLEIGHKDTNFLWVTTHTSPPHDLHMTVDFPCILII